MSTFSPRVWEAGVHRPELSIATSFDYGIPIEEQFALIAEAGFTHVSLGHDATHSRYLSEEGREGLRSQLGGSGLRIDTIHGPRVDGPGGVSLLAAVVEAAAELDAPVVVVHAGPFDFGAEELPSRLKALLKACECLEPELERTGLVLALENVMPGPATELVRLALQHLDSQYFGFCYDSAHDQIGGPRPFDLLAELGDRMRAVHLNDRARDFVDHLIPGEGYIDWPALCRMIQASGFTGPLALEVATRHSRERDARRFLRLAYERGSQLCSIHSES